MSRFRRLFALLGALALLAGCAQVAPEKDETVRVLATTYPVYLFTTAVVGEAEGVEVTLLVNAQTSCLHDYTLTVKDMKAIDQADVIVMNGGGLEDLMADALGQSHAAVIDCSQGVDLLLAPEHAGHDGHDHEEEYDPHYWMDPARAAVVIDAISDQLSVLDDRNAAAYAQNAASATEQLRSLLNWYEPQLDHQAWMDGLDHRDAHGMSWSPPRPPHIPPLITFHDGFQYFADAFGLDILKAIEEEEGAAASAAEIKEIVALVEERGIPAIFVEKNGSRKTADAIARETGCSVYELDMLMSGDGVGIQAYLDAISGDLTTILEAFS